MEIPIEGTAAGHKTGSSAHARGYLFFFFGRSVNHPLPRRLRSPDLGGAAGSFTGRLKEGGRFIRDAGSCGTGTFGCEWRRGCWRGAEAEPAAGERSSNGYESGCKGGARCLPGHRWMDGGRWVDGRTRARAPGWRFLNIGTCFARRDLAKLFRGEQDKDTRNRGLLSLDYKQCSGSHSRSDESSWLTFTRAI